MWTSFGRWRPRSSGAKADALAGYCKGENAVNLRPTNRLLLQMNDILSPRLNMTASVVVVGCCVYYNPVPLMSPHPSLPYPRAHCAARAACHSRPCRWSDSRSSPGKVPVRGEHLFIFLPFYLFFLFWHPCPRHPPAGLAWRASQNGHRSSGIWSSTLLSMQNKGRSPWAGRHLFCAGARHVRCYF